MVESGKQLIPRLRRALESVDGVRAAYLFGSRGRDGARPGSDLDIAISYAPTSSPEARERVRRQVMAALVDVLGPLGERADLLDLARAGAAVGFEAIRRGAAILARSELERIRLEASIARRYDDEAPRRQLFRRAAVRAGRHMESLADGRS